MGKRAKVRKITIITTIALVLILVAATVAFKIYTSHYYAADDNMVARISAQAQDKVAVFSNNDGISFVPKDGNYRSIIVFYPGGKVEYTAYSALMYELASRGFICLLIRMPENIAILGFDAADDLVLDTEEMRKLAGDLDWYIAGHSLGGAAASKYLAEHFERDGGEAGAKDISSESVETGSGEASSDGGATNMLGGLYKGLILCGAYPANDLSKASIRMLSIYGSNDGVMNREAYEEYRVNWPVDSTEVVIDGGNHSYFGCYGIQDGDGEPTISNEQQIKETADIIEEWIG